MQIDLQPPLAITRITHGNSDLKFEREGNVYWVYFENDLPKGVEEKITVFYEGTPVESKNPPWSGGVTWGRDDLGEPFIVTTARASARASGGRTKITARTNPTAECGLT